MCDENGKSDELLTFEKPYHGDVEISDFLRSSQTLRHFANPRSKPLTTLKFTFLKVQKEKLSLV